MAYKVISDFKDLRDGGYEYKAGDTYPHTGTADAERVKHLMTPTEQRGALLEEVARKPNAPSASHPHFHPFPLAQKRGKMPHLPTATCP